jgi:hypothetical protein
MIRTITDPPMIRLLLGCTQTNHLLSTSRVLVRSSGRIGARKTGRCGTAARSIDYRIDKTRGCKVHRWLPSVLEAGLADRSGSTPVVGWCQKSHTPPKFSTGVCMSCALTPKDSPSPSTGARTICGDINGLRRDSIGVTRSRRASPGESSICPACAAAVGHLVRRYGDSLLPNVSARSSPMRWSRGCFGPPRAATPGLVA